MTKAIFTSQRYASNSTEPTHTCLAEILKGPQGQAWGFEFEKKYSCLTWAQFRSSSRERVIVNLRAEPDGTYWFKNMDSGTVGTYYALEKLYGSAGTNLTYCNVFQPKKEEKEGKGKVWDLQKMRQVWEYFQTDYKSSYLHTERRIPIEVLEAYRVKTNALGACFLGQDDERKTTSITFYNSKSNPLYSKVGKCLNKGVPKGLVYLELKQVARHITICESAIDCLAHASLRCAGGQELGNYISSGGRPGAQQLAWLRNLLNGYPDAVILALDNDKAGRQYTDILNDKLANLVCTKIQTPENAKDWAEVLLHTKCNFSNKM